jgi:hypothetical protein
MIFRFNEFGGFKGRDERGVTVENGHGKQNGVDWSSNF